MLYSGRGFDLSTFKCVIQYYKLCYAENVLQTFAHSDEKVTLSLASLWPMAASLHAVGRGQKKEGVRGSPRKVV